MNIIAFYAVNWCFLVALIIMSFRIRYIQDGMGQTRELIQVTISWTCSCFIQYIIFLLLEIQNTCPYNIISSGIDKKFIHSLSFWIMVFRDASVTAITFYHCVNVSLKEKSRLINLQEHANLPKHLVDLKIVFDSVMPRAYFIQFLNQHASANETEGHQLIDCVDLY